MMTFLPNRYPTYKPSGVEWLEEVPAHWEVRRGKYIFRCIHEHSDAGEEELLTVSSENGVIPRRSTSVTMFKAESYVGHKLCWPEDLVINSLWAWGRGLGVSKYHGIVSTAYGVYRLRSKNYVNPWYMHTLVRSTPFHWEIYIKSKGIWKSRLQLADKSFLETYLPLPPLPEQRAIVRYLDYFDRRIQRFVRAKQKLIKLLEEQKQVVISRAVTRGLDPDATLKDSGVEWLGKVPAHWEVRRLKSGVANLIEQANNTHAYETYIALEHVESWTGKIRYAGIDTIFDSKVNRFGSGDILFGKLRPYLAKVARPDKNGVCVSEFLVLRPFIREINSCYLEKLIRSKPIIDTINATAFGAKMPRAAWKFIGSMEIPLPPLPEQRAIVEYLDKAIATIDAAIARAQREVELVNEYRTRLVGDVVTGKLDVREAASELPDEPDDLSAELDSE